MRQHIENRLIENFGPHRAGAMGIVLAFLVAGCGKHGGSGNQDAAGDAPPTPAFTVVFSSLPATLYVGQTVEVTATITASVPLSDIVCLNDSGSTTMSNGYSADCNGLVAANTPCKYSFSFVGHDSDIVKGELETDVSDTIICRSDTLNVSEDKRFYVTLMLNQGSVGDGGATYCSIVTADLLDAGRPSIQITSVPPRGASGNAEGTISGADPYCNGVVVYIRVDGGWWIKPYYGFPLTTINHDGTWSADIVTGGIDQDANSIVAYLVPNNFDAPQLLGYPTLLPSLDAYPSAVVNR
jgi:hypothetical protein